MKIKEHNDESGLTFRFKVRGEPFSYHGGHIEYCYPIVWEDGVRLFRSALKRRAKADRAVSGSLEYRLNKEQEWKSV
jgi:hypothetical protein